MKLLNRKYKGFTLSELMIMLAVLTVLLAAFAPVFTVRYNNATSENVWAFVQDDKEQDAYTDQVNKVMPAQLFVGITPSNMTEVVSKAVSDGTNTLYSKLVIRPTDQLPGLTEKAQKQMQFRYGDTNTGSPVGALFAGNQNILLGGDYKNISSASDNTAYGKGALNALTSGSRNSALGYNTLRALTNSTDNTAIGALAGENLSNSGNTLIGYNTSSSGNYVTAVGDNLSTDTNIRGNYSTVIGTGSGYNIGNENTIIGANAGIILGYNNTSVGARSLSDPNGAGYNNTAIGYKACSGVTGSNKTCIGYYSGVSTSGSGNGSLLSDEYERVFIGSMPVVDTAVDTDTMGGAAVLEVHNIDSTYKHSKFSDSKDLTLNLGNSSVVVNGNLIVRGQSFFSGGTIRRPGKNDAFLREGPSLMGFHRVQDRNLFASPRTFAGDDGEERSIEIQDKCGRRCHKHSFSTGSYNCICVKGVNATVGRDSYDWTTNAGTRPGCVNHSTDATGKDVICYTDATTGTRICDSRNEYNNAHNNGAGSCCPDLRSDIRLKNVSGKFTGGLDEIKKLMIYNYTYKSDAAKTPHVGVIAQDLKRVFPTAVKKDENGFYQIRWDEMLYAAINAIKTLNTKVEQLASRVSKDQVRIANLKKDNAQLEKQLDTLSTELTLLEKKRK